MKDLKVFSAEKKALLAKLNSAHRVVSVVPKPMLGLARLNLDGAGQVVVSATPGGFQLGLFGGKI